MATGAALSVAPTNWSAGWVGKYLLSMCAATTSLSWAVGSWVKIWLTNGLSPYGVDAVNACSSSDQVRMEEMRSWVTGSWTSAERGTLRVVESDSKWSRKRVRHFVRFCEPGVRGIRILASSDDGSRKSRTDDGDDREASLSSDAAELISR